MSIIIITGKLDDEIFLNKLNITELRELILHVSGESARLEKENKTLKEENRKITGIANNTSVALAELRQGVVSAINDSDTYFNG